jgi:tetratricopeptide (TPR) repeat protein
MMKKTLLFLVFFQIAHTTFAQIDKGWAAFSKNDFETARKMFNNAVGNAATKADAHLGLSLVESSNGSRAVATSNFMSFVKASNNPFPYCQMLWLGTSANGSERSKEELEYLDFILKSPKADAKLKAWATQLLANHYFYVNDFEKGKTLYKTLGAITQWATVGGFENISGGGFDKEGLPIEHPESDFGFKDKKNGDVKWLKIQHVRYDNYMDFGYHYYTANAIFYAQTFVDAPTATSCQLRLGSTGSLKVWVNDKLIFIRDKEEATLLDCHILPIELSQGANRILLQVGDSHSKGVSFLARLTDKTGKVLNLNASNEAKSYPKSSVKKALVQAETDAAEMFFKGEIAKNPTKLENYLILSQGYWQDNKLYEARKLLKKPNELYPECLYLIVQNIVVNNLSGNSTLANELSEKVKTIAPESSMALNMFFDENMDGENFDKAGEYLDKIEENDPISFETYQKKLRWLTKKNLIDKLMELMEDMYKKFPNDSRVVMMKYRLERDAKNNKAEGLKVLNKYLKTHYDTDIMETVASHHYKNNNPNECYKIFKDIIQKIPNGIGFYNTLSSYYSSAEQYDEAITYLKACTEIAPSVGDYYSRLGETYTLAKKPDLAKKAYEKALSYNNTNFTVRRKLRDLNGQKDVFTYFKSEDPYSLYKKAGGKEKYPNDHSVILLEDIRQVVYPDGVTESKHEILVKMLNPTGVDSWKEYGISSTSSEDVVIEKAEVIKENGQKIPAETNGNDVVFTNLAPNDAIYISYKKANYYSGTLASQFWEKQYFTHGLPFGITRYSLLVAPQIKFEHKMENSNLKPTISDVEGFKLYVWEKKDQKAINFENSSPNIDDFAEVMHVSSLPNWDFVSKWYADLTRTKAAEDFEVKETVDEILRGKEKATSLEKVKLFYEYIVKNIRYSSISFRQSGLVPQKASEVINTKIGDCKDVSTLMVAMCKVVGIDANLVLVNTRDNGKNQMALPSIDFNHCIAAANIDGKTIYMELTSDNLDFGAFPYSLRGAFVLPILENKTSAPFFLDPENRVKSKVLRKTTLELTEADANITVNSVKTGTLASSFRGSYRDLGEEDRFKEIEKSVGQNYNSVKFKSVKFIDNLKDLTDSVRYTYSYQASDVFTEAGDLKLFKPYWSEGVRSLDMLASSTRETPIDLFKWSLDDLEQEEIAFKVPQNHKADIPEKVELQSDFATYSLMYKRDGNNIVGLRKMIINPIIIPATRFDEFKTFFQKVIKSDQKQLVFKKSTQ